MTFEGKTILITGATGLLGTHLVKRFLDYKDCTIVALGRSIEKLDEVFKNYQGKGKLVLMKGDVSDRIPVYENDFDYIFHAASPIAGDIIRNYPVSVIKPNILGTINCLEYLKQKKEESGLNCKMVVFSSATVYSNTTSKDCRVSEEETSVADTLDSANAPYSESKRMAEVIARAYAKQYDVQVFIARFSYLYGYSKQAPNTAFYEFINNSLHGEGLLLNSDGAPKRDNIYVDDAVNGLLCLIEKGIAGESYNISSGGDLNNYAAIDEIAEAISKAANKNIIGSKISVSFREHSEERKPGIVLDNGKLKALGWRIENSLEEGVNKTFISYIA